MVCHYGVHINPPMFYNSPATKPKLLVALPDGFYISPAGILSLIYIQIGKQPFFDRFYP